MSTQPGMPATGSVRPPRIVHVINSLHTGGAETMLARLVDSADPSRFEHVVLPLLEGGPVAKRVRDAGALAAPLRVDGAAGALTAPARLARRLRRLHPDVVQGWLLQGNLAATIGTGLARMPVPVLWNVRWTLYDVESERRTTQALLKVSGLVARQPSWIVFNSRRSVGQHAAIGYPLDRARVIPNGYDLLRFRPDPVARAAVRDELGIPSEATVCGMVARYHPMKDHAMSLRAAAYVAARRPEAVFVYAGRDVDDRNEEMSGQVRALGLADRVRLLGERDDVGRLFASFDVYWMSSAARGIAEGFPNVVAEAMASGIPCVATDIGDAAEIVGTTGRVVPSRDWHAFGAATVELLALSADSRMRMGASARARIAARYSLDAVTASYEALYREVIDATQLRSRPR